MPQNGKTMVYLEYCAIGALVIMALAHIRFASIYSRRIRQLDRETELLNPEIDEDEMDDALIGGARMSAQAEVDRTSNLYALAITIMCASGLAILAILHHLKMAEPAGWMSLLLLSLPALMLVHHIRNTRTPLRRRSLWSGSSAQSR